MKMIEGMIHRADRPDLGGSQFYPVTGPFRAGAPEGDDIHYCTLVVGEGDTPPKVLTHAEAVELFDALIAVTKFIPQPRLVEELQRAMKEIAKRYITL